MDRTKKWILFSIVLVFITGILAGVLAGLVIGRKPFVPACGPPFRRPDMDRPMPPEKLKEGFVQKMTDDLSLAPDQVTKLRDILKANEKDLLEFRENMRDNMQTMRRKMTSQIKGILNDEQRKKFEEIDKRMNEDWDRDKFGPPDERWGEEFEPPGPRHHMGPPPPGFQPSPPPPPGPPRPGQSGNGKAIDSVRP